jgi:hypothetical protein
MKNLILILFISILGIGCKKCVTCDVTTRVAPNQQPVTTSTISKEVCGSKKDIEAEESAGNYSNYSGTYPNIVSTTVTTTCK